MFDLIRGSALVRMKVCPLNALLAPAVIAVNTHYDVNIVGSVVCAEALL